MRRIYDGKLRKEFGTADDPKSHEWTGRITFLVAVTPAIDRYASVIGVLGERFVIVRWPRASGVEAAVAAMEQDRERAPQELRSAVHALLNGLPNLQPTLSLQLKRRIGALSEIAVRGRAHVVREGYNKDITYVPEPESNTRLPQQLAQLARGSALLDGRSEVSDRDLDLVKRVAFDCMPPVRKAILEHVIAGRSGQPDGIPGSTVSYGKKDLEAQGLLTDKGALSSLSMDMLAMAGVPIKSEKVA